MKIGKTMIWLLGFAIFLAATLVLSGIALTVLGPLFSNFGILSVLAVFIFAIIGAWIMKKGSKPA